MAKRPIFIPSITGDFLVISQPIVFEWVAGMAESQKQKRIDALHQAAHQNSRDITKILEVSTKSKIKSS